MEKLYGELIRRDVWEKVVGGSAEETKWFLNWIIDIKISAK